MQLPLAMKLTIGGQFKSTPLIGPSRCGAYRPASDVTKPLPSAPGVGSRYTRLGPLSPFPPASCAPAISVVCDRPIYRYTANVLFRAFFVRHKVNCYLYIKRYQVAVFRTAVQQGVRAAQARGAGA